MVNQFLSALVDTVDVAVNVDAIAVGPVVGLVHVQFVEALSNLNLVNVFGDVNHLSSVLDQTAVLSFRGFVGAQSTPLGGVKVTGLEVGLASHERGSDTAHVGEGCEVGGPVEELAHP